MQVIKRNGNKEDLDIAKISKVLLWASKGNLEQAMAVEINSKLHFYEDMPTSKIHDILINSAADLISTEDPGYSRLAAKLVQQDINRKVPTSDSTLSVHIDKMVVRGIYDDSFNKWSDEDLRVLNLAYQYEDVNPFQYAGIRQVVDKYLLKDRVTGNLYETPKQMFMAISMQLFVNEKAGRIRLVTDFYKAISTFKINLPTPVMCGVRTPNRQYSSCTLIDVGDSLDSIIHSDAAVTYYTAKRAGIGLNVGRIREVGSKIRNGEIVHTGLIPFLKKFEASTKCCTQGGVRGGTSTSYYPFWHPEFKRLIVLKNNKGTEDNRVRKMDYGVQLSSLFYKRVKDNSDISLFSPADNKELYAEWGINDDEFNKLYHRFEAQGKAVGTINAREMFSEICKERIDTGRIYIMNIDTVNDRSSFTDQIVMSNLCAEITLPTKPITDVTEGDGEIALCVLAAVNMVKTDISQLPEITALILRALDNIITEQDYPVKAAEKMLGRRSVGVGVTNLAGFLSGSENEYGSESGLLIVDEYMESLQYHLIKASVNLAIEHGKCETFHKTKYSKGILPIDTWSKEMKDVCDRPLSLDWETLRKEVVSIGMRNSTLTAIMPCESSSVVSNSTNGIEPPRAKLSVKKSKTGVLKQLVPGASYFDHKLLAWNIDSNKPLIENASVMQRYVDQSISLNTYYNPSRYPSGNLPISVVMNDIMYAYRLGIKTLYYANTNDGKTDKIETDGCASGACSV